MRIQRLQLPPAPMLVDRANIPARLQLPSDRPLFTLGQTTVRANAGAVLLPPTADDPLAQLHIWGSATEEPGTVAARVGAALQYYFARYDGPDFPLVHAHVFPSDAQSTPLSAIALGSWIRRFDLLLYEPVYDSRSQPITANWPPMLCLTIGAATLIRHPVARVACYVEPDNRDGVRQRWFINPSHDDRLEPLAQQLRRPFSVPHLLVGTRQIPLPLLYLWGLIQQGSDISPRALGTIPLSLERRSDPQPACDASETTRRWWILRRRLSPLAALYGVALPGKAHAAPLRNPAANASALHALQTAAARMRNNAPTWSHLLDAWIADRTAEGGVPAARLTERIAPDQWTWEQDFCYWLLDTSQRAHLNTMIKQPALQSALYETIAATAPEPLRHILSAPTQHGVVDALITLAILHYLTAPPLHRDTWQAGITAEEHAQLMDHLIAGPQAPARLPRSRPHGTSRAVIGFRRLQPTWLAACVAAREDTSTRRQQQALRAVARAMLDFRLENVET
ncbi:MAG: hypothetical protein HY696_12185 [Deltaproteobacteria bacterium]|nr:hypothetical protein [Deltaproteobacteria bacterium]